MKRKKIISLLLIITMMTIFLPAKLFYGTESSTEISLLPSVTDANPGDTITYTLKIGPVENVGGMHFIFDIPNGLTFVESSGTLANNLKKTLGADNVEFVNGEEKYFIAVIADGYSSASETTLMTFQCSVDDDASGTLQIGISDGGEDDLFYDTSLNDIANEISSPGVHIIRPCTHENKTEVPAKDATCTEEGNTKYYICDDCGKVLKADGVTETTKQNETIAALGHDYGTYQYDDNEHWRLCQNEGCDAEERGAHSYQTTVKQEATADKLGSTEEKCTICGKIKENSEKYYVAEGTAPSEYPNGTAISEGDTEQATAIATLEDKKVELTLEDPLGTLEEGFTVAIEDISKDLGADFDGNYNVANAYKANVVLKDEHGHQISGELGGKIRLLLEVPEELWDEDDLQVLRINPGEDTEYDESIEYRLYNSNGEFIKVVDKNYQPEADQTVKKFLAIWTDHFSDYAIIDPVNTTPENPENNNGVNNDNNAGNNAINSALKTGQNIMEAYFIVTAFSLSVIAIYLALKKKKMFENK